MRDDACACHKAVCVEHLYVDVVEGAVVDIWFVNGYGQDRLLAKEAYTMLKGQPLFPRDTRLTMVETYLTRALDQLASGNEMEVRNYLKDALAELQRIKT